MVAAPKRARKLRRRMVLESLEDRVVLSTSLPVSSSQWTAFGPAPIVNTQIPGGGPMSGNVSAIATNPSDPNTILVATPGGGVWKTTDGGFNWNPLTDNQPTLFVGEITIAPSNSNIIYAGTGDPGFFNAYTGQGILKSVDGGQSWNLLTANGRFSGRVISRIVVNPANPNIVYAAVQGPGINGQTLNTGIWRSTDGGLTWTNTTAGISTTEAYTDLEIDPANPSTLYAAIGSIRGSTPNGVYRTTDGGNTWAILGGGIPSGIADGRISLAVSPSTPGLIFASIVGSGQTGSTPFGTLFKMMKSTNGGTSWTDLTATTPDYLGGEGAFATALAIDPLNSQIIYAGGTSITGASGLIESRNGGQSWGDISVGVDGNGPARSQLNFSFDASGQLLTATNGGIFRLDANDFGPPSTVAWSNLNGDLQITNFNSIALDPFNPNIAYGGAMGTGTAKFNDSPQWDQIRGRNGGVVHVDPKNSLIVYHTFGMQFGAGFIERSPDGGQTWTPISNGINIGTANPDASNIFPPFVIDPSNSLRLLLGTNRVYETLNSGGIWNPISTPGQNGWTSPATATINSVATAATDANTIYATTSDGRVYVTRDHGATWVNRSIPQVSDSLTGLIVDPSNPAVAYVVRNGNVAGNTGRVFRTTNAGQNWTDLTGNLPDIPSWSFALDARVAGAPLFFVGTDAGVYASNNQGVTWSRFATGLPNAQVLSLELNTTLNLLAAGTNGRGMFEIKEINPVQVVGVSPPNVVEGQPLTNVLVATFTDADGAKPAASYHATINWGDGTAPSNGTVTDSGLGSFNVTGDHTYQHQGTFTITVTVVDSEGNIATSTAPVNVANATLTPLNGFTLTSIEGQQVGGTFASFQSGNPFDRASDFTVKITWGDGAETPGTVLADGVTPGKFNIGGAHAYLEVGTYPVSIIVTDVAGGGATVTITGTAVVSDAPLNAVGQTFTATEGLTFSGTVAAFTSGDVNATTGDFAAVIDWGDNTATTTGIISSAGLSGFSVAGQHAYLERGTFTVTVTVIDHSNGRAPNDPTNATSVATSTANVVDAPLSAVGNTVLGTEGQALSGAGQPLSVLATFTDANPNAQVSDYASILINWGDNQSSAGTITALGGGRFSVSGNHTYAEEGTFTIQIPIESTDGIHPVGDPTNSRTTAVATATIVDAPLAGFGTTVNGTVGVPLAPQGQPNVVVGSFTDANPLSPITDFTAVINWGDGTPGAPVTSPGVITQPGGIGTTFFVSGTHTYARAGTYTIVVSVTDVGGSTTTITTTAVIADAALTGTIASFPGLTEGSTFFGTVATFSSANTFATAADFIVPIDWGDGNTSLGTVTALGNGRFSVFGSNTFATQGTFPVTVTVISLGGSRVELRGTINVANAPILAGTPLNVTANEGVPFTGLVGTFKQSGNPSVTDFTATINWGDGNTSSGQVVALDASTFGVTGTNTYTSAGTFNVSVQVSDNGGSSATLTATANVQNALVTATGVTINALLGQTFSGVAATFHDANAFSNANDFSATINWGDGNRSPGEVVDLGGGNFQVRGTNLYDTPGRFNVVVTILDDGGATAAVANSSAHVSRLLTGGLTGGQTVTRNTRPAFNGTAEPGSTVQVFAQLQGSNIVRFLGETRANSQGVWSLTSSVALAEGRYTITGAMNDAAGTRVQTVQFLPAGARGLLTIDTTGPVVVSATFNPALRRVVVTYRDNLSGMNTSALVNRTNTSLTVPGSSRLLHPTAISLVPGPAGSGLITATLTFPIGNRIAPGTYVFRINGASVTDRAGNRFVERTFVTFPQTTNSPNPDFVAAFNVNANGQSSTAQPFVSAAERRAATAYLRWVLARTKFRVPPR